MLGFAALAEVALAEVPGGAGASHAWRRLLIQRDPRARLNRDAPHDLVWNDEEEEFLVQYML